MSSDHEKSRTLGLVLVIGSALVAIVCAYVIGLVITAVIGG